MANSFLNASNLPLGLRNNNPGNIRPLGKNKIWLGQVGVNKNFVVFSDVSYGIRAIAKNAITQITKNGKNTVQKYITAYAPPSDGNDTAKYIKSVSMALGVKPNAVIKPTFRVLHKLIRIHIINEISQHSKLISDADITLGIIKTEK